MNDKWQLAKLVIEHKKLPWADAQDQIASWSKPLTHALLLTQSFLAIEFKSLPADLDVGATFSGRIFDRDFEIRWQLAGTNAYLWRFSEVANSDPSREGVFDCEYCDRKYYLWGEWTGGDGESSMFQEGRMPEAKVYPVKAVREHDRAFIEVREYRPAMPSRFEEGLVDLMQQLNQPRLLAHRFLGVGVHQDA